MKPGARHRAREAALQMLYQWELGGGELDASLDTYLELHASPDLIAAPPLAAFATSLVRGVVAHGPEIDALIAEQAEHWRLARMAVTDRIILRLAVYEFLHAGDTPRPVVIDEAVELAKTFSGDEAGGFVNGVLDGIRRRLDSRP
ncbi:MAG: transcription antitermination factor NusB [Acidobacteria bacterium]|nr:transcription antitermination factor NusB [Acidobacteriota bacterium]